MISKNDQIQKSVLNISKFELHIIKYIRAMTFVSFSAMRKDIPILHDLYYFKTPDQIPRYISFG